MLRLVIGCGGSVAQANPRLVVCRGEVVVVSSAWTAVGLFAGVGGLERGLAAAKIETELLCEIDPGAAAVLRRQMPEVGMHHDVQTLRSLPVVDVVAAGFP